MPVRRLALLLGLVLASLTIGTLSARGKKPSELYAERYKNYAKAISARYVQVAKWDYKNKLYQFELQTYEYVIDKIDPNCREARERLGYVRRKGKWVLDEEARIRLGYEENEKKEWVLRWGNDAPDIRKNQKPQKRLQSDQDKLYEEHKELFAKAKEYAAGKYADLGVWCRKKGLELQALKAFEISLKNDPECSKTRKALGHVKIDDEWLTPQQAQARKEAKEGKSIEGRSQWDDLGFPLKKMISGHFRIETVREMDQLKRYVKEVETCYAYFLRDFGEPPDKEVWPGRRGRFLVLGTKEQWHQYVDRYGPRDPKRQEFQKKTKGTVSGPGLLGVQYDQYERIKDGQKETYSSIETTVDGLVHKATHMLVAHYLHLSQPWIKEGFAYYYTVKVLNSTRSHCVAWDMYSNVRNDQDWGNSDNWKVLIKEEVASGSDFDLRMLVGLKLSSMKKPQAVKAWSMITWFFDHQKDAFKQWLSAVAKGMDQDAAFQEFFGKKMEDLDAEWRAYVLENY